MPNTNEENKNTGSETGWKRERDKIKRLISDYKAVTGLILYLYFSAVGYVYDYVYYLHYGLDILKYERPEDFIFSIFHHGILLVVIPLTILLTIVLLIYFGFLLKKFGQWLKAGNGQKGSDDEKSEKPGKPDGKQVPDKAQIKNGDVGGRHHLGKRIRLILQKMIGWILQMIGWILQKILGAQIVVLVVVAFMVPFGIASFLAQTNVAGGSENKAKGRLYTVDPDRHLDDAIHIGSTADYMIFFKNGNNNAGGGNNKVRNSDNQEERDIWIWLSDKIKYCLLNWCTQFDREKGVVFVVPTSNVASFDVEIKDLTVDKATKDEPSDKGTKDQTLDNLWMPAAENRSFPESYLFIGPDTQSTYPQVIPYVVVDPQKDKKPEIKVPLVYSLPYIKTGASKLAGSHKKWLQRFYESAGKCSGENRRVRIRVRGFASNEPYTDKNGNKAPNSDIQNSRLAKTRAHEVKNFLESLTKNTPDGSSKLAGSPFTIEFDPWRNPQDLVEHRIGWGTIKPNFLNRSVHIIIEDAGKCSNRGEDEP